jgi:hypothetical protein
MEDLHFTGEHGVSVGAKEKGHGEALPASPWPLHCWNDGTDRSTLPIHGISLIGTATFVPEPEP